VSGGDWREKGRGGGGPAALAACSDFFSGFFLVNTFLVGLLGLIFKEESKVVLVPLL
jgi:hypothetical protein